MSHLPPSHTSRIPASELPDLTTVARYLSDESDIAERELIERWAQAAPANARWLAECRRLWFADPAVPATWDLDVLWQRIMAVDHRHDSPVRHGVPREKTAGRGEGNRTLRGRMGSLGTRTLRGGLRVGAAVAAIVGMLMLVHRDGVPRSDTARVYTTHSAQQAIVRLDDHTRVTLAPQTALRVLSAGVSVRTVTLERGEAYFEVAHMSGSPFVVYSGRTATQVLGTAFLIRYDPEHSHVRVAVTEGKVRLIPQAQRAPGVILTAGQVGVSTDSTTYVSTDDLTPKIEWAAGWIMFRDTPLATVLQTISRWYGYQFRYTDQALAAHSVTMAVSTQSSAEALAAIERVVAVNLMVVGDTVTLTPEPQRSSPQVPRTQTYDIWTPTREVGR